MRLLRGGIATQRPVVQLMEAGTFAVCFVALGFVSFNWTTPEATPGHRTLRYPVPKSAVLRHLDLEEFVSPWFTFQDASQSRRGRSCCESCRRRCCPRSAGRHRSSCIP